MKKLYYLLSLIAIIGLPEFATAKDSEPDEFKRTFDEESFFNGNFKEFSIRKAIGLCNDIPFVEFDYGISNPAIAKSFDGDFSPVAFVSASAGYLDQKYVSPQTGLCKESASYITYTNYSGNLGRERDKSEFGLYGWQLDYSVREAIGWNIASGVDLMLYHGESTDWASFNYDSPENITSRDEHKMSKIADGVRFGRGFSGGVELRIGKNFGVFGGYEQEQIFPRLKFWKWCGSELIEIVASSLADEFIDAVMDKSKIGGPIIYFLVKNTVSYGVYELRKSDMNWPFNTESPLYLDKFSIGINFAF